MKSHSVLAICHVAFLAGVALYIGAFYPALQTLALLLVLAGTAVECCPSIFQKPLMPSLLLGAVVAAAWWTWPHPATPLAMYRAAGLLIAYLILVPSRMVLENTATTVGDS